jgi:putative sterol carrier protein
MDGATIEGEAMAVDIPNIFNEQLPGILQRNAEEAKAINAKFQMNITGAGSWHIDLTSAVPTVSPGEKPADCTVTVAAEDFAKLQENPSSGMQLFFAGKLKIAGNQMLGMKLQKLLSFK